MSMENGMPFCERLSEALRKSGMSQREFAKRLGITEVSVSRYLSGKRIPRVIMVFRMAEVLGVAPGYLVGEKETEMSKGSINESYADKVLNEIVQNKFANDARNLAIGFKSIYDNFIKAGFSEQMAKEMVMAMLTGLAKGGEAK